MAEVQKSPVMTGRKVLYTSETVIDESNVVDILNKAMSYFTENKTDIQFLYDYYKGYQPILTRTKKVRANINNKILENHAFEIISFKTGYVFGEPLQYVNRADKKDNNQSDSESNPNSDNIAILNSHMFNESKANKDRKLAEWSFICGTAYRMVLANENKYADVPFETDILDPRYTAVIYNNGFGKHPVMSFQEIAQDDGSNLYCIFTPTKYFEVKGNQIVKNDPHTYGAIPVIEYPANTSRLGAFEIVLPLLDAINMADSNRMDGLEQFIQSFIKFTNCKFENEDDIDKFLEKGAISVKSDNACPSDVDILSQELNQSEVQVMIDHLYQMILIICGMPDRNGSNRTTGDTGQAVLLRDGWSAAETAARDTELMFSDSEKQFLKIVLRILSDTKPLDLKLSDIDIKFSRNKTDNLLTKTQGLQNMLEAGVHPRIAINNCGLFSDPEQVYIDSLKYLEKWLNTNQSDSNDVTITPANNKPNPTED